MCHRFGAFGKDEAGSSLVEYAISLIVVATIGATGFLSLAQSAGGLVKAACATTGSVVSASVGSGATAVNGCYGSAGSSFDNSNGNSSGSNWNSDNGNSSSNGWGSGRRRN